MKYEARIVRNKEYESMVNHFRVSSGLTHKELESKSGVGQTTISALANGMLSPLLQNGKIRISAQKLVTFFKTDFPTLFPRYFCDFKRTQDKTSIYEQLPESVILKDPAYIYEKQEYVEMLFSEDYKKFCDYYNLKDWHLEAFILRYVDDCFLVEISEKFKRSSERIRQI